MSCSSGFRMVTTPGFRRAVGLVELRVGEHLEDAELRILPGRGGGDEELLDGREVVLLLHLVGQGEHHDVVGGDEGGEGDLVVGEGLEEVLRVEAHHVVGT